ncbi:serine/threonine-protein kinase LMTK1 [Chelmon rostratus]|uniref:serine/threonine-protein kinase LMTK1 n=1 Tax=Chelmon rostratus TaxID=109905 RepID=UPI001BE978DC|nr:serine/threonine-protein kinase LMTK1 [Chelmon rostratus]
MSSAVFSPGFALSSHFSADGAPLSELSWSSSLAVVAISFSGLFTFVFLMLACLCCKKGKIGFKEFKNVDGEEYHADMSTLASPASQGSPDVYILPLTEVSLPVAKQPARSVQLLKSTDLGRHSLLYLKEIGNGWFGKVLLGEVNTGLNTTQVVVKELKASASVQDQMHFLEEAQPYRALQHHALVQCLAQCTEVTPYLLVMEFCPLGDVKGYLRSCRTAETMTPEPLILQRMACDIASGLLHLHKHNFTHSDLALRNCLLSANVSVKIGDYGLSHTKYKDDYYITSDQVFVPLRWIAPELVDEVHGNLLVADQTQQSNMWSLGVTIWELFELGNQPYRHYSDRQVLTYAVREQQLRLPKPLLKVPLAERWYEVMQFCWLQPDQRPNAEEVHLLLSYLCAKGASEAEEDFERRWNSLRPNTGFNSHRGASAMSRDHPSSTSSSFPLLEQFSAGDGYHSESGDDILTVTETSHGLNFEYKWEQARADQSYRSPDPSSTMGQVNHHCQEAFYPPGGIVGGCPMESLSHGVSPSYYQAKHLHAPGILPVLSAHSPSVSSEYYIRIEEPVDCNIDPEYTMCSYSPDYQGSSGSFLTGSADSGECMACPSQAKNMAPYWSADIHKSDVYDSNDSSPAISLTMEPLLGQVSDSSPLRPWESSHYVSYKDRDGGYYYEHSPPLGIDHYLIGGDLSSEHHQESWGSRSLRQALGELENPLGISPSVTSPPQQAYRDAYLDTSQTSIIGKNVTGGYYDMMGSLRKTMPSHTRHNSHSVSINMETEGALFIGHRDSDSEEEEEDIFVERHTCNTWPSKHSHSSVGHHRRASHSCRQDAYVDFHYTMPSTDIEDSWPEEHSLAFHSLPKPIDYLEPHQAKDNSACLSLSKHHPMVPSDNCNAYIYLCHEGETQVPASGECCHSHFVDPLTGLLVRNNSYSHSYSHSNYINDKIDIQSNDEMINLSPAPGGPIVAKPALIKPEDSREQYVDLAFDETLFKEKREEVIKENPIMQKPTEPKIEEVTPTMSKSTPPPADNMHVMVAISDPQSELSHTGDSGVDQGGSAVSLADILDCSDDDEDEDITDDITDVTSGIFADESSELNASPAFKSLQKQVGTPDSMDSMDLPSAAGSCEGFSPASSHPSSSPKAMDSGYDTENNESPEFVPKEPHEPREQPLGKPTVDTSLEEDTVPEEQGVEAKAVPTEGEPPLDEDLALGASETGDHILLPLSDKTPYRDSAYFSDYENERQSRDEGDEVSERVRDEENGEKEEHMGEKKGEKRKNEEEEELKDAVANKDIKLELKHRVTEGTDSSSPQEMEAYLTEECGQDEVLGLPLEPSDTASLAEAGMDEWPSQEESSSLGDWAAEVVGAMEEALGALNGDCISNIKVEEEDAEDLKNSAQDLERTEEPAIKTIQNEPLATSGEIQHTLPKDEVALQHTASTRRFSSSSPPPPSTAPPPLPAAEGRGSPGDGEEADEEDGDTDDSDESDEELRSYSVQEQSAGEESEDECHPVPIVVSDDSEAHKLRSLLKMPTLLTVENLEEELERKKKTVSFFDDVTVYLFDQESPTKELAEHGFPLGAEGQSSRTKSQERVNASDDSSDGNISEESAGYEWEDDFPLLPLPTSTVASDSPPPRSTPKAPDPKPAVQHSRFTVSPSTVSRFSITHISDSDMDSVGGSSEDGDKE